MKNSVIVIPENKNQTVPQYINEERFWDIVNLFAVKLYEFFGVIYNLFNQKS